MKYNIARYVVIYDTYQWLKEEHQQPPPRLSNHLTHFFLATPNLGTRFLLRSVDLSHPKI